MAFRLFIRLYLIVVWFPCLLGDLLCPHCRFRLASWPTGWDFVATGFIRSQVTEIVSWLIDLVVVSASYKLCEHCLELPFPWQRCGREVNNECWSSRCLIVFSAAPANSFRTSSPPPPQLLLLLLLSGFKAFWELAWAITRAGGILWGGTNS